MVPSENAFELLSFQNFLQFIRPVPCTGLLCFTESMRIFHRGYFQSIIAGMMTNFSSIFRNSLVSESECYGQCSLFVGEGAKRKVISLGCRLYMGVFHLRYVLTDTAGVLEK